MAPGWSVAQNDSILETVSRVGLRCRIYIILNDMYRIAVEDEQMVINEVNNKRKRQRVMIVVVVLRQ